MSTTVVSAASYPNPLRTGHGPLRPPLACRYLPGTEAKNRHAGGSMGWLQENGVVLGTFATTAAMLVGIWWHVLRSIHTDIGKLGGKVEKLRLERQQTHASISAKIAGVSKGLSTEITEMHKGLNAEIAGVHKGLSTEITGVRDGIGGIRGELKGVTRSIDSLREDFRARVFGSGGR